MSESSDSVEIITTKNPPMAKHGFERIDMTQFKPSPLNQFNALFRKSAVYQWRQYKTNICQLLFPLLLIGLLYWFQTLVSSVFQNSAQFPPSPYPPARPYQIFETDIGLVANCPASRTIPLSEAKVFDYVLAGTSDTPLPLYLFEGTPNVTPLLKGSVDPTRGSTLSLCFNQLFNVTANWEQFNKTTTTLDKEYYDSYAKTPGKLGAIIFNELNVTNTHLDATLYYNQTLTRGLDLPYWLDVVAQGFFSAIGANTTIVKANKAKAFPSPETTLDFDLISFIGPFLYVFIFQLTFPVILGGMVYEKEARLKEIMLMMGLNMNVYWVVTYIFSYLIYFLTFAVLWIAGAAFSFRYWTVNSPLAIFVTFFLWGHTLVAFCFFFYSFFSKSRSATTVGYIWVFASGLIGAQVLSSFFRSVDTPRAVVFVLSIVPQFALFRGLFTLSNAVAFNRPGLTWEDAIQGDLYQVWIFFAVETVVFLFLGIYFDKVLPTGYGVKLHPLFFLMPSYWRGTESQPAQVMEKVEGEPDDVAEMRRTLVDGKHEYLLRIEDLRKVHKGSNGVPDKIAVKSLALGVNYGECFGFLGPNGAGKSTSISIISGLYPATSGTVHINGLDIQTNIQQIHMIMGVCPQDNVLWEDLNAREHLYFFGRIKNMTGKALDDAVEANLRAVNLHNEDKKTAGQFSGGMKRRLAVACAFMGNPKVVLLDEPSTGLDPASRRQLWDLINDRKKGCALLLTTHHMEEADALSDRIAIFVGGALKCIGSSSDLKRRYGKGYKVTITCDPKMTDKAAEYLMSIAPNASMLNTLAGTSNYEVPKSGTKLSVFFNEFEMGKSKYGITDWGISNTTLEEVFLKITEQADQETKTETVKEEANYHKNTFEMKHIEV